MLGCAVALVLLMDVSASVSDAEWVKQRDGTAEAFSHPAIQRTIENLDGGIAVKVLAFGGKAEVVVPWHTVKSVEQADSLSAKIKNVPRRVQIATEIGKALDTASSHFATAPCAPERKVIDISTDGIASQIPTQEARDRAQKAQITVNAIGVGLNAEIEAFLRDHTITEDGFAVISEGWDDFALAIRRKIIREIAGPTIIYWPRT